MPNTKARPRGAQQEPGAYTVLSLAQRWECSHMHIRRLIAAGELVAIDISTPGAGRPKIRIRSQDAADYLDRKASKTASRRAAGGGLGAQTVQPEAEARS